MSAFERASTWDRDGTSFTSAIEPAWAQGKGAYGGLLSASLLRAMTSVLNDAARTVRTLHVCYCAPARVGPIAATVHVERAGSLVTTMTARCQQEGKLVTLATATFVAPSARPAERARFNDARMPTVPPAADVEVLPAEVAFLPSFTRFFEYRFCMGDAPYSSSPRAALGAWVRLRDSSNARADAPLIAALIDTSPPAVLPRLDAVTATASVNLTVDFLADPALIAADEAVLHASSARVGNGGTTDETQDLWTRDGVLLATCRQLVVVL